jgi:hypothetical protein
MEAREERRGAGVIRAVGLLLLLASPANAGPKHPEPEQVLPMAQIPPTHREGVAEVIRDHTLHRKGQPETFPCNPRIYLNLVNEPILTLALWKDLSPSPATLQQVSPNRFTGTDGAGTSATWEYLIRSPRLHVMLCHLDYTTPRGNGRLQGRIVLVVRSGFFKEVNGELWVQHDIEMFVKIDSRGWKAAAATLRPLIERILDDQVQEAGLFVSLMGRLVEMYPDWASSVAAQDPALRPEVRDAFRQLVQQTRRPNASPGRPVLADATGGETRRR